MSGALKIPGKELQFGGDTYVVAPLNAAAVKQHKEKIARFLSTGMPDLEEAAVLLQASLARNYPGVTLDQVLEWVDYGNVVDIMDVVMNTSGIALAVGNLMRRVQTGMSPAQTPP